MQLWCRSVHLDGNTVLAYLSWRVAWTSHSWCGLSFLLWWQINLCPWSVNYCPSLSQPGTASLCTLCQLHPHSLLSLPQSLPVLSLSFSTFSFSVNICSFLLLSLSFRLPWCLLFSKLSLQLFYHLFFFCICLQIAMQVHGVGKVKRQLEVTSSESQTAVKQWVIGGWKLISSIYQLLKRSGN